MNADRWRQVEAVCEQALARTPEACAVFLDEACATDVELRREVESLLAGTPRAERFLQALVWPSPALEPGTRLGSFEVLGLIGVGGMGEVYKARDTRLDRIVALKTLPPEVRGSDESRARFWLEAKTISQLNHPHICTLHDIGEAELTGAQAVGYLVMELLEGETLAARLAKGPLPLAQALEVGAQIAEAMAAAHKNGVVHRDLKPGNVMLTKTGAKLLDFGLAKFHADAERRVLGTGEYSAPSATTSEPLTGCGVILGTLPYLAPEQLEGKPADARTDLWALGTVLYEMLTGKRAWERDKSASVMGAVLEHELQPLTPPALDRVVRRCLAEDPDARWQDAADLAAELRRLASQPGGRRRRSIAAVTIAVAATVAVLAWFARGPGNGAYGEAHLDLSAAPRPLTALPGVEKDPAVSPDGTHVAFVWNGGGAGHFHVYVVPIDSGGEPVQVTRAPADDARPVWSPNGDRIAFLRRDGKQLEIRWTRFPAGQEKFLRVVLKTDREVLAGLDWSPDGRHLAVEGLVPGGSRRAIFLLHSESAALTQLTFPPRDSSRGDSNPKFSPDGNEVAFVRGRLGGHFGIYAQRIADGRPIGEPRQVTPGVGPIFDMVWSPDGTELIYTKAGSPVLWRIPRSGGEPRELATTQDALSLALDRGGRLVYGTFRTNADIWRAPGPEAAVKTAPAPFIRSTRNEGQPRYSPDGTRIAFVSDRSGSPNVWLADADGTNQRRLTDDEWAIMPQWSPHGDLLAFDSRARREIYVMGPDDAQPTPLTGDGLSKGTAIWSPDGDWIYFSCQPRGPGSSTPGWQICKVPSRGGRSEFVVDRAETALGVDERFLYFHRAPEELALGGIWRVPHEGGAPAPVLDEPLNSWEWTVWRGQLVYIDRSPPDGPAIRARDLAGGRSVTLATVDPVSFPHLFAVRFNEFIFGGLTVSPGGQWILYGRSTVRESDLMVIEASGPRETP